jgi:hypothetical protein
MSLLTISARAMGKRMPLVPDWQVPIYIVLGSRMVNELVSVLVGEPDKVSKAFLQYHLGIFQRNQNVRIQKRAHYLVNLQSRTAHLSQTAFLPSFSRFHSSQISIWSKVRLRTDDGDLSRSQTRQKCENFGHQWQSSIKLGAAGHQHHHRDLKFGGVLLKAQVAVGGQENIEFLLRERKQLAVFDAALAHFLNRDAIMPGQRAAQTPVEAFINENAHGRQFRAFSFDRLQ